MIKMAADLTIEEQEVSFVDVSGMPFFLIYQLNIIFKGTCSFRGAMAAVDIQETA